MKPFEAFAEYDERLVEIDETFQNLLEPIDVVYRGMENRIKRFDRFAQRHLYDGRQIDLLEVRRKRVFPNNLFLGPLRYKLLRAVEVQPAPRKPVRRYVWFPRQTGLIVTSAMNTLSSQGSFNTTGLFDERARGMTRPREEDWTRLEHTLNSLTEFME